MRLWNLQLQMNFSTKVLWGQEKVAIVERYPLPCREVGTRVNVWTVLKKKAVVELMAVSEGSTVFMPQERRLFPAAGQHNCCARSLSKAAEPGLENRNQFAINLVLTVNFKGL